MEQLPKHILKALRSNKTSLGEHPAFPPEDEEKFVIHVLTKHYNDLLEEVGSGDVGLLKKELSKLLSTCLKHEQNCHDALEKLAGQVVCELLNIPTDTVDIRTALTSEIDTSNQRMFPEQTEDYSFENIKDMNSLTDEIYKRRILNCLIAGTAMRYANDITTYIQELFKIDPELPTLYRKILSINNLLLYVDTDSVDGKDTTEGGAVDVTLTSQDEMPVIESKAILFPILVEETIKGVLELVIAHGLPQDREKAKYVMQKADFKLAEVWDLRLGLPLSERIFKLIEEEVEPTFLFMELSKMKVKDFNEALQEVFAGTKEGRDFINGLVSKINRKKKLDDFEDYIQAQNSRFPLDDDYFHGEEILNYN